MNHSNEYPVEMMCRVFGISKSGYYKWLKKYLQKVEQKDELNEKIEKVFDKSRQTYGSPRIAQELNKENVQVSKSTVARRMKELEISPKIKKKFKSTTDSKHNLPVAANILNRNFDVKELNKVWVSDITYIRVSNYFLYLTVIIDLADRMVVGWNLSDNMTCEDTVMLAFKKAVKQRIVKPGLVFHSDRGVQYASDDFRKLLTHYECIQSMSRKGNCWDNAVAESFFKTIKVESLYRHKFINQSSVYSVIFDYIDGWYNTVRIHSTLDGKSPLEAFKDLFVNYNAA